MASDWSQGQAESAAVGTVLRDPPKKEGLRCFDRLQLPVDCEPATGRFQILVLRRQWVQQRPVCRSGVG